ncbi:putative FMN-dependent luciferase-like monooxygenase [Brevibacterium sp. RIT 803]|uniref:putative FMN-dependent luciferase-like monooxygenase n=1 Tax=Brevibacterium sp. RIT 803 TaxID=2810210 RepID=UPI0019517FC7|nr:putative FMN-dependent luciferase-like monooxygenase [Brevibacterium sp. RIT 803]MBM6591259.1 putative FMN-dependent luciferase-like monooxygenase [Brevibacterium sp. RIT 803]
MTNNSSGPRLGFFTRLLEDAPADQRYRFALEQIQAAETHGFDSAWVAQHHFSAAEGGLPSPLVFLAHAAAQTSRIRLGTAIITLPMENGVRVAEDVAVTDVLSGGRLEIGLGSGGNPKSFPAFGTSFDVRREVFADNLAALKTLLAGKSLETGHTLYPQTSGRSDGRGLSERLWQATFSSGGAGAAGAAGDGLMLSRTQPRAQDNPGAPLDEVQLPVIDTYLSNLPAGIEPRILASRTAVVAETKDLPALRALTEPALRSEADRLVGYDTSGLSLEELLVATDTFLGTPEQVIERLSTDRVLSQATDVSFQVHSVPATNETTLRSIELLATEVAPALGLTLTTEQAA